MKYLENNICVFKPLFNIDYSKKKNIVSSAFFKLHGNSYKNFNLYIDGLEKLYNNIINDNNNFTLRIFIDNSIYNDKILFTRIEKLKKIEIVVYNCPNYIIKDNNDYHIGLFGTLVRFFPMFDFPNNDANIVIISDIDDYEYFNKSIKNMSLLNENINDIFFLKTGNLSKNTIYFNDSLYKDIVNPYTIASNFISFKRINNKLIELFLNQMSSSDEIFSQYKDKLKSNSNLLTGNKFIYGFDEYFLNLNLTSYLVDNKIPYAVKFNWEINGSLYWYLSKKNINKQEEELINLLLTKILKKINYNKVNNLNIKQKYKILDKLIYKNDSVSYKINLELYEFFIESKNNTKYNFLFQNDIYKIINKYGLFGSYNFEMIIYNFIHNNSNHVIIFNNKFKSEDIDKLKSIQINEYNKISRENKILKKFDCDIKFINNLSSNKNIFVDIININGKKRLIKKELEINTELPEYNFVTKYYNKIKKANMDNFINLPLEILNCSSSKIYMFDVLDFDYNNPIITSINYKKWIEYTLLICLTVYYLNNVLNIYHNDLCWKNDIRNIMIKSNNQKIKIIVNNFNFETNSNYPVLIDFGWQNQFPQKRTLNFYNNAYKKRTQYKFISEVFIIYYYSFKIFFQIEDYWDDKYDELYDSIANKSNNKCDFDSQIINYLFDLCKNN